MPHSYQSTMFQYHQALGAWLWPSRNRPGANSELTINCFDKMLSKDFPQIHQSEIASTPSLTSTSSAGRRGSSLGRNRHRTLALESHPLQLALDIACHLDHLSSDPGRGSEVEPECRYKRTENVLRRRAVEQWSISPTQQSKEVGDLPPTPASPLRQSVPPRHVPPDPAGPCATP